MKTEKNILTRSDAPLDVALLVLDDCNTLSFAAAVDPLRAANRIAQKPLFSWNFFTPTDAPSRLTSGLFVDGKPVVQLGNCDLLIVVAGFRLKQQTTPALLASLRRIAGQGTTIAGIDGGPWIMAAAGILDGHSATTHWEDLVDFSQTFPYVTALHDRYHVSRDRLTSGGAAPAIDMMLHVIATRFGEPLAARVASAFIYDSPDRPNRPQLRHRPTVRHSPLTARATAMMESNLDTIIPIKTMAKQLGTSPRALEIHFQKRLGTTPKAHYQSLRMSDALRLVCDSDLSLLDIALSVGFSSQSSFSRAFHAAHGQSARSLRNAVQTLP